MCLIRDFRKELKLEESLDPINALFLSREFIEQGFIEEEKLPESLIGFFDLNLVYSTFLQRDDM